ncbi:pentapeptide repeat-containing protein [Amycolatopsis thailandensis]|uniref:pentapeptide repeat-containing protein n=1 Tax=Amycolatopsis thailandensis TaxID=589330 RepID=UPI0036426EF3
MTDDPQPVTSSARTSTTGKRLQELTPAAMWTTALVITILTAGAVIALWWPATAGLVGADLVRARLDALKIGLSIGVGSGGVVALYLAWRRQHSTEASLAHQERTADDARTDAVERRITELYLKAAELLGSEKAPVRLSGLYALERLAQDNETQRQTIVNVFCAYLRMSYDLPAEKDRDEGASAEQHELYRERAQEREVRLAAQRLLNDHLNPDRGAAYWGELDLDLTGALLIDFDLTQARVGTSFFRHATFTGMSWFFGTTFTGDVRLGGATFTGDVWADKATFNGTTRFDGVTFTGGATFRGSTFTGDAWFIRTTFTGKAWFDDTTFTGDARFDEATFTGDAKFNRTTFTGDAKFDETTFTGDARFRGATLGSEPFQPTFASDDKRDASGQSG